MTSNAPHWAQLPGRHQLAARSFIPHTPTGLFAADNDGGCQDGQAASNFDVNARRIIGDDILRAKLGNVVGGGRAIALPHITGTDRARTIPRPFAAPFKFEPFHFTGVTDA